MDTVLGEASLRKVAESLAADGIGALGVVQHGHLAGVVSERDIVNHLAQWANPERETSAVVTTTDLVTAHPEDLILDTARRTVEAGIRHPGRGAAGGWLHTRSTGSTSDEAVRSSRPCAAVAWCASMTS